MELQLIKHDDILFRDILRAVSVKSVAWPHPIESQLKWIIDNMHPNDLHVFLTDGVADKAYMTMSSVEGLMNGNSTSFMGVGCVCSANPGKGEGKLLIFSINQYLDINKLKGLLFCKQNLIDFYSKYYWKLIPPERVQFKTPHKGVFTMVYNCEEVERLYYNDRFF